MSQPSNSRPPQALFGLVVCLAFVVALGGCSSSTRLAMNDRPVPVPRPAQRNPVPPAPDHKSALGRPAMPATEAYAWNGSPNRISEGAPYAGQHSGPHQQVAAARPQAQTEPPPPIAAAAATAPVHLPRGSILVQPGDTLYGLSRRHGVSISALMDANKLKSLTLQPGQMLKLPATSRPRG